MATVKPRNFSHYIDISFLVGIVPGRGGFPFEGDFGIKVCKFKNEAFSDYKIFLSLTLAQLLHVFIELCVEMKIFLLFR